MRNIEGVTKRCGVLAALFFLTAAAWELEGQTTTNLSRWEPDIQRFEAMDRTNPPPRNPVLFIGSSAFRLWKTLAEDFPGVPVVNRGFGGSEIHDSTEFAERIIFPYHPRIIVLYAGDNDLSNGKSPDEVVGEYQAFVKTVHARMPDTFIDFVSIKASLARWKLKDKIVETNRRIAAMKGERLAFVDIFSPMLDVFGRPRKEMLVADGLHPSARGYRLWASVIRPVLDQQMSASTSKQPK